MEANTTGEHRTNVATYPVEYRLPEALQPAVKGKSSDCFHLPFVIKQISNRSFVLTQYRHALSSSNRGVFSNHIWSCNVNSLINNNKRATVAATLDRDASHDIDVPRSLKLRSLLAPKD